MEQVWVIAPADASGRVELTLAAGPPRPLVATLTAAELARVEPVLPQVDEAVRRGEFSRVRLGAAFREAIGRDPFRQVPAGGPRKGLFPWWGDLAYIVVGLGFAAGRDTLWLRLLGYALAAVAAGDLLGQAWRRLRIRSAYRG